MPGQISKRNAANNVKKHYYTKKDFIFTHVNIVYENSRRLPTLMIFVVTGRSFLSI